MLETLFFNPSRPRRNEQRRHPRRQGKLARRKATPSKP
jgi:hypothetical protein